MLVCVAVCVRRVCLKMGLMSLFASNCLFPLATLLCGEVFITACACVSVCVCVSACVCVRVSFISEHGRVFERPYTTMSSTLSTNSTRGEELITHSLNTPDGALSQLWLHAGGTIHHPGGERAPLLPQAAAPARGSGYGTPWLGAAGCTAAGRAWVRGQDSDVNRVVMLMNGPLAAFHTAPFEARGCRL